MQIRRILACACLLLATVSTVASARRARAGSLEGAMALYQSADFSGALKKFEAVAVAATAPKDDRVRAYKYAGLMHVAMGKQHYTEAEKSIQSMLKLDPAAKPDPEEFPESYMRLYYKSAMAQNHLADAPRSGLTTVAIMDFDNNSIGEDATQFANIGRGMCQMLITDLSEVPSLRLVEREKIQFVLDELKLQASGAVDKSTAARVGKLVGAQALLFGGVMVNGKDVNVTWRLVSVETGEILKASQTQGRTRDLFQVEKDLGKALTTSLKVEVSKDVERKIENTERPNLDATLAYSEAIKHLDQGNIKLAYTKFAQASKLDPKFQAAKRRAGKLKALAQSQES